MDLSPQRSWETALDTIDVAVRILSHALSSKEGREFICALGPKDVGLCLELLDRGLATCPPDGGLKKTFLLALIALASRNGRLPSSFTITGDVEVSNRILASGGFADVKPGVYRGRQVAVKVLRVSPSNDMEKIRKRFYREVVLWGSLSHPNILKLLGVTGDTNSHSFSTVAELMVHGNIMEYIKANSANRLELLHGVVQGLKYIHDADLVYGDLKGANILVNNEVPPRACLADFGFTTMVLDPDHSMFAHVLVKGGTFSFMAPELLAPKRFGLESFIPSREADVFAFGLVMLQVLTGDSPFNYATVHECTLAIIEGARPGKPENAEVIGLSDPLWKLAQACWAEDRTKRPHICVISSLLRDAAVSWHALTPPSCALGGSPCLISDETVDVFTSVLSEAQGNLPNRSGEVPVQLGGGPSSSTLLDGELSETATQGRKFLHKTTLTSEVPGSTVNEKPPSTQEEPRICSGNSPSVIPNRAPYSATEFARLWAQVVHSTSVSDSVRILAQVLVQRDGRTFISHLKPKDAELCIELLGHGISKCACSLNRVEQQAFFVTLRRLAGSHGRLPVSMMISEKIEVEDGSLVAGGFADVRIGRHKGHLVAVKTLRIAPADDFQKIKKQFCKEVVLWSVLSHPHVLKLKGVYGDMKKGQFTAVSEWMSHGNVMCYIEENHANRLKLLHGAAQGLKYIHDAGLTHGDLKGANILMSNDKPPRACLADFGFMTTVPDPNQLVSCSVQLEGGTIAFMAPELLMPSLFDVNDPIPTPEADVYAFGMVIFQVLTGETPFRGVRRAVLGLSVVRGLRPEKPADSPAIWFSDALWTFVQRCWDRDRNSRPRVTEVVMYLAEAAANSRGLMPPCGKSKSIACVSDESMSRTMKHSSIFLGPPSVLRESPASSQTSAPSRSLKFQPLAGGIHLTSQSTGELPVGIEGVLEDLCDPNLPPPKLPIRDMDSGSLLSAWRLEHSLERPAVPASLDSMNPGGFVRSPDSPPLKLAETNAECQDHLAQEFIDRLDMRLDQMTFDRERHELLNDLCKMCSRQRMLPKSMHLAGGLTGELVEEDSGGYAVISRAQHKNLPVAVKTVRITSSNFDECHRAFCREAVTWRHLRHPNILPLLGVDLEKHRLSMISEWMDQGNINEYLKRHQGVNRLQLLAEVATGLEYMHGLSMVHGDLKGANILINQCHRACLADFGLSTIVSIEHNTGAHTSSDSVASKASLMSFTAGGTFRWMSPELLDPEQFGASDDRPTKKSDCYALGMVVYEVLSGNSPYWHIINEYSVITAILEGYRPKEPDAAESLGFTNELRKTIQQCWLPDASARPDVRTILSHLNHATWSWERRKSV